MKLLAPILALSAALATVSASGSHFIQKRGVDAKLQIGYSTTNGGTTGGAGGSTTTVTSLSALRSAVKGDSKKIVYISGVIKGDGKTVDVGSNTSILGKGTASGLTASGFRVIEVKNVIIRNLKLGLAKAPFDAVAIQESTNVWIDHNTFANDLSHDKDFYDGLLDITHAADFVTVSWNVFTTSFKTSLIGHSASNGKEDKGHLRVTYHHNYFVNVNSRLPSLRFGTGHIYNNYYSKVTGSGINVREGAQALVEGNYFESVKNPIMTKDYKGFVVETRNVYKDSDEPDTSGKGNLSKDKIPYSYSYDGAADIPAIVKKTAGVGKVTV